MMRINIEPSSRIVARLPFWTYEYAQRVFDIDRLCPSVTCGTGGGMKLKVHTEDGIRELTPREYWRLMGLCAHTGDKFDDSPYEKAAKVNSPSQLYKQAGNSICPDVMEAVFEVMLVSRGCVSYDHDCGLKTYGRCRIRRKVWGYYLRG